MVLAALFATARLGAGDVSLPMYYADGMVFQADQDQTMIWGFTSDAESEVLVTVTCDLETEPTPHKTHLRAVIHRFNSTAENLIH